MSQTFQKRVEDFVCGYCGAEVHGDGYTNHCPKCLWSRHVDVYPGDRASVCGALMKPVSLVLEHDDWKVTHRCIACGHEKKNRCVDSDDVRAAFCGILTL